MKFSDLKLGTKFRWADGSADCIKNSSASYLVGNKTIPLISPPEMDRDVELVEPPKVTGYWIALVGHGAVERRFVEWSEFTMISMTAIAEACVGWELGAGAQIKLSYGEAVFDTDNTSGVSR